MMMMIMINSFKSLILNTLVLNKYMYIYLLSQSDYTLFKL